MHTNSKIKAVIISAAAGICVQIVGVTIIWNVFFRHVENHIQSEQANNLERFEDYIGGLRFAAEKAHVISLGLPKRGCELVIDELRLMLASMPNVNAIGVSDLSSGRMCGTTVGDAALTREVLKMQDGMYGALQFSDHNNVKSSYVYYRKMLGDYMAWALLPASKFSPKNGRHGNVKVLLGGQNLQTDRKQNQDSANQKHYSYSHEVSSAKYPIKILNQFTDAEMKYWFFDKCKWYLLSLLALSVSISVATLLFITRSLPIASLFTAGVENDEFEPCLQPIVDARTGRWVGAEVLISWPQAPSGARTPDIFIPMAENFGHIEDITWQAMRKTAHALRNMTCPDNFFISFNASRELISNPLFARECRHFLESFKANNNKPTLCIEITERDDSSSEIPYPALVDFSRMGVKFTVDNFGAGYSNIESLKTTNLIDKIKIGKIFIDQVDQFKNNILLDAIFSLAEAVKLNIIADGVKTEYQQKKLLEKRINIQQGPLYSPPIQASGFIAALQNNLIKTAMNN
ncbi:EAL domain-containing protein [Crenobacter caeni]|uniref:EAL domain-containing protein n=1 Tax=Crenobacter caeni TaxID=2705474 RepID=UPI0013D2E74D